jgi:hypothetical protein
MVDEAALVVHNAIRAWRAQDIKGDVIREVEIDIQPV